MRKIKKGDQVVVIVGRDKGKRGAVVSVLEKDRVVVEGVNVVKKHVKPVPARGIDGGIIDKTLSIHISNIALINPVTNKPDRVGVRVLDDGRKIRVFKSTNEAVDV